MARTQIQNGSQGNDVKELQKLLNSQGYSLTEDGIFGKNTEAAVRDYQTKNNLTVDGIVGNNTWGALLGKSAGSSNITTQKPSSFTYEDFTYDTAKPSDFSYGAYTPSESVAQAEAALNAQLAQKPGEYKSQWQAQLDDAINKILNREQFSYDLNGDALYQQLKDKHIQQGKMAMGDAIGQASAMTGGYGNSWAQSVGQQAYNAQLQNLNDMVPELYQMALDKHNMEGQDLYNQYAMLGERENTDYGRYQDNLANWQTERDYLQGRYDSERNYDYGKYTDDRNFAYGQHRDEVTDWQNDRNFEYGKYADDKAYAYKDHEEQIAYDKWLAEYNEAKRQYDESMAFNREQYEYSKSQANSSGGGGGNKGTTPSGASYDNGGLSSAQIKELQKALGVSEDGYYGANSKTAAGGLSAEEAYKKFVGGGTSYTYEETPAVTSFAARIRTRAEFARGNNPDKQKYGDYNSYVRAMLEKYQDELTDNDIATISQMYGL